jgi:hypothetical protein
MAYVLYRQDQNLILQSNAAKYYVGGNNRFDFVVSSECSLYGTANSCMYEAQKRLDYRRPDVRYMPDGRNRPMLRLILEGA